MNKPCPYCESIARYTQPGELGYGTEVYCDDCGFRLANVDPEDSLYR